MRARTILVWGLVLLGAASTSQAQDWVLKTPEAVLEANIKATGGAEAWKAIKSMRREGAMEMDSPMGGKMQGTFVEHVRLPGYSHRQVAMDTPMGNNTTTLVNTPEKNWVKSAMGGTRELPMIDWVSLRSAKEERAILDEEAFRLTRLETEIADTGPIYIVTMEYDGKAYERHYDQLSLMLLAAERPAVQGGKEWIYYEDYRDVEGVKIPHVWTSQGRIRVVGGGGGGGEERTVEIVNTMKTSAFNVPVKDDLFRE